MSALRPVVIEYLVEDRWVASPREAIKGSVDAAWLDELLGRYLADEVLARIIRREVVPTAVRATVGGVVLTAVAS